jgi:hypothetical protein
MMVSLVSIILACGCLILNGTNLEAGAKVTQSVPCEFNLKGRCIYGDACRFSHSKPPNQVHAFPVSSENVHNTTWPDVKEEGSTLTTDAWGNNTERDSFPENEISQTNSLKQLEATLPSALSENHGLEDENMTASGHWNDNSTALACDIDDVEGEEITEQENYPLSHLSPTNPSNLQTDSTESTETFTLDILLTQSPKKSFCVFLRRGVCKQGINCQFAHSVILDQEAAGRWHSHLNPISLT